LICGFAFAILRIVKHITVKLLQARGSDRKTAIVKERLSPEGTAFYQGELWTAISNSGEVEPGEEVTIDKVEGLRLLVTKKAKE
jgi:membrane-bound ClpP family serine protease